MPRLLIVEDDVLLRAQLARALHKIPEADVLEAGTVAEARALFAAMMPELVVADLRLPDGTALELLPHLVRGGKSIPIVFMSGCASSFAGSLPPDIKIFEKPVPAATIRDMVTMLLGCGSRSSPFTVADYLQLASFGHHSVQLDVFEGDDQLGSIVVRDGAAWSARDTRGEGMDAFVRLVTTSHVTIAAEPPQFGPRNLQGPCERLLFEVARLDDERRAGRLAPSQRLPAATPLEVAATGSAVVRIPPKIPPPPPGALAEGTTSRKIEREVENFDRLYEDGIDALLAKRYADAFALLTRARKLRTMPTLEANLQRLRSLGFA